MSRRGEVSAVFGLPSIRLGKPFGIPLEVDASWVFIFFLVAASLVTSYFPAALPGASATLYVALGLITALAFFSSLVLHELAHSLVARAGGLRVAKVTLFLLGGVSQMEDEPRSARHELLLALAGPGMSVALGLAALGIRWLLISLGVSKAIWLPFEYIGLINFSFAAFNLLPGYPLDGGRVLRAIIWAVSRDVLKATRWASRAGQALGLTMIALAVFGVLRGSFDFVWFAVIGWFLTTTAGASYQQQVIRSALARVPLSAIMSTAPVLAPAEVTLDEMAHSYFLGGRHTRYPVVDGGRVVGLIDLARVSEVPREQWSTVRAGEVAAKDLSSIVARPETPVERVLPLLEPGMPGAVLVVEDGRLAGIVTRADVIRFVRESVLHQ